MKFIGPGGKCMTRWIQLLTVTSLALGAAGSLAQGQDKPTAFSPAPAVVDQSAYTIGPEDILDIRVWKNDAISCVVQVRPDGFISLPLLNDVKAADLTPLELRQALLGGLAEHIANPEVSILIKEVHSYAASVVGEVARPGRYDIRRATTVLELLAEAGGFTAFASRSNMAILRHHSSGMQRIPFNYSRAIEEGGEKDNILLVRGDIVVVP